MLNIDFFITRLELLMERHEMNAAAFAEEIGVQRSSISHVLSKRNKPSLEFLLKISQRFEVSLDWLVSETIPTQETLPLQEPVPAVQEPVTYQQQPGPASEEFPSTPKDTVKQLIQVFDDNTFKVFLPNS